VASAWRRRAEGLSKTFELLEGDVELTEDLVEEGWPDFPATVDRDGHAPTIGVDPPLMASSLPTPHEAQDTRDPPKLPRWR